MGGTGVEVDVINGPSVVDNSPKKGTSLVFRGRFEMDDFLPIREIDGHVERVDGPSPAVLTSCLCRNVNLGRCGVSETVKFEGLSRPFYLVMRVPLRETPD